MDTKESPIEKKMWAMLQELGTSLRDNSLELPSSFWGPFGAETAALLEMIRFSGMHTALELLSITGTCNRYICERCNQDMDLERDERICSTCQREEHEQAN